MSNTQPRPPDIIISPLWMKVPIMLEHDKNNTTTPLQPSIYDPRKGAPLPLMLGPSNAPSMQDGAGSFPPASMTSWQWPLAANGSQPASRPEGNGAQTGPAPYASPPQATSRHVSPNTYDGERMRATPRGPGTRHRSRSSFGAPLMPLNPPRGFGPGSGPGPGPPSGRYMRSPPSHASSRGPQMPGPGRAVASPLTLSKPSRLAPAPGPGFFPTTAPPRSAPPVTVLRSNAGYMPPPFSNPFSNALSSVSGAGLLPQNGHGSTKSPPSAGLAHSESTASALGETARLIKRPESVGSANPQPVHGLAVIDEKPGIEEDSDSGSIHNPPANPMVPHPNTHSLTKVYDLVQMLETIPRLHNILVCLFTWLVLLGFVVLPGAFMSSARLAQAEAEKAAPGKRSSSTPSGMTASTVLGFLFVAAGITGTAWLAAKWHKNYLWLINKLYLPTMLNALAGMIATIVAVSTQQAGSWNTQAAVTIVIEVAVLTISSVMFGAYNYWLKQRLNGGQAIEGVPPAGADRSNNGSTWSFRTITDSIESRKTSLVQRMQSFRSARSVAPGSVV